VIEHGTSLTVMSLRLHLRFCSRGVDGSCVLACKRVKLCSVRCSHSIDFQRHVASRRVGKCAGFGGAGGTFVLCDSDLVLEMFNDGAECSLASGVIALQPHHRLSVVELCTRELIVSLATYCLDHGAVGNTVRGCCGNAWPLPVGVLALCVQRAMHGRRWIMSKVKAKAEQMTNATEDQEGNVLLVGSATDGWTTSTSCVSVQLPGLSTLHTQH
jgi:hypothetical protein